MQRNIFSVFKIIKHHSKCITNIPLY